MALWLTTAEADAYFATRYGASDHWTSGTENETVLATAQADLEYSTEFVYKDEDGVDLTASGETPSAAMKAAVCEQALFLLQDPDGIWRRASLQAQGVRSAGIVGEAYTAQRTPAIAPRARQLLRAYTVSGFEWSA